VEHWGLSTLKGQVSSTLDG